MHRVRMSALMGLVACPLLSLVSPAHGQAVFVTAQARAFTDSVSTGQVELPDRVANATAGFNGVENVAGSTASIAINNTANTRTNFGFASVSAGASATLMAQGTRLVVAGVSSSATSTARDQLTFSWADGFDDTQPIEARFFLDVLLPTVEPGMGGFVFTTGAAFRVETSVRVTQEVGFADPTFLRIANNQNQSNFAPGLSTESGTVSLFDNSTVNVQPSMNLVSEATTRANTSNPADQNFSSAVAVTASYRVWVQVPEGVLVSAVSGHDYTTVIPAPGAAATLALGGLLATRRRR